MSAIFEFLSRLLGLRRISMRLALSYGLLLGLFIAVVVLMFLQIQKQNQLGKHFAHVEMRSLLEVQALNLSTEGLSNVLLQLLTAPQAKRVQKYAKVNEKNRHIDALLQSLKSTAYNNQQLLLLQGLQARRDIYHTLYLELVNLLENNELSNAQSLYVEDIQPALSAMLEESSLLLHDEQKLVQDVQQQSQQDFQITWQISLLLAAFVIGIAGVFSALTARSIVSPLARLRIFALRIASGDYLTRMENSPIQEINEVGASLHTMAGAIAERERKIAQLAYYDAQTQLPNRTLFLETYPQPICRHSLLLLDLARLKTINETLGYDAGDSVISAVAGRIQQVLNRQATPPFIARLAGGTFAILVAAADVSEVEALRAQVEQMMRAPHQHNLHAVDISLVAGMAMALDTPLTVLHLLRNAEVALNAAKHRARPAAWYCDAQEASRLDHLSLLLDLRSAIQVPQLQMWLQPKLRLSDFQLYGFEALVRWQHPERGLISPTDFIPFAERAGHISAISFWMLENAVIQLHAWRKTYPYLSIAVNISAQDLHDPQFPEKVSYLLRQYAINPQLLCLEMTESDIMEDSDSSVELLHKLRTIGIGLSIDDFGTGYSSLAYLRKLPVDEVKIDRSFIAGIDRQATMQGLVKAIIEMGRSLDLHLVAEGIETLEEQTILRELGCDAMQGYLLSKPLHGKQLKLWLIKHHKHNEQHQQLAKIGNASTLG